MNWQDRKTKWFFIIAVAVILLILLILRLTFKQTSLLLWQIGNLDKDNREFALAPDRFEEFKRDGLFVVGQSDSRIDWPYVQPGPGDKWAGRQMHTFQVVFGIESRPDKGRCKLKFRLLDTHRHNPPRLRFSINGQGFEKALPPGGGDASLKGNLGQGKGYRFEIPFEANLLKAGNNEIQITTLSGSWFLYDWLGLEVPPGVKGQPVISGTWIEAIQPSCVLREKEGRAFQEMRLHIRHFGGPTWATIHLDRANSITVQLKKVFEVVDLLIPAVLKEEARQITIEETNRILVARKVIVKPVRKMTVFILPHSHTDIGYTDIQTTIEKKQADNLLRGMEYARKTEGYPPGARFVWNVEVLWAADRHVNKLQGFITQRQGLPVIDGKKSIFRNLQQIYKHPFAFIGADHLSFWVSFQNIRDGACVILFSMMGNDVINGGDVLEIIGQDIPFRRVHRIK